jgi:hypothetical protein
MLISARIVKPRRFRVCEECKGMIVTKALRLYGAAESGDKPYVVWTHPDCTVWSDPKILKAKETLQ